MPNKTVAHELFHKLNKIDVSKYVKKKGKFTYLSWAWAVRELLKADPTATWMNHEYTHKLGDDGDTLTTPYMCTTVGFFVKVTVTAGGISRSQTHPVLDHSNQTINNPNAFDINTAQQRCLAKAIALHGLGLYIYAGEDLPTDSSLDDDEIANLKSLLTKVDDPYVAASMKKKLNDVNKTNYNEFVKKLKDSQKGAK